MDSDLTAFSRMSEAVGCGVGVLEKSCAPAARVAGRGLGFGLSTGTDCSAA